MQLMPQKITPFLWYDTQAEEAANFYCSLFPNSRVLHVSRYSDAGPGPAGSAMMVSFVLDGLQLSALNGGPHFKLTEAFSLQVRCESQEEVDELWAKLTADGGEESMCGWLKDKYGLSWQITPTALMEMVSDPDPAKAGRAMQAMMQQRKIEIAKIRAAYNG
jgi:predicted 3-demethylubiquinone-9 3-methyltransferase (glyoxalase superfamily)